MTVDLGKPHQLEKGNITAHSVHWKQENIFLTKLWRYILGGLETQNFEYHPFKDMRLLVASITSRMLKSATDNFGLAWKMNFGGNSPTMKDVAPGLWPLQLFLMVAIHFPCLNFEPWPAMCTCISCKWQPKNMIGQKNLYGHCHAHSGSYISYFVQACCTLPSFLLPLKWGWVWVFPLGHEYYGIIKNCTTKHVHGECQFIHIL